MSASISITASLRLEIVGDALKAAASAMRTRPPEKGTVCFRVRRYIRLGMSKKRRQKCQLVAVMLAWKAFFRNFRLNIFPPVAFERGCCPWRVPLKNSDNALHEPETVRPSTSNRTLPQDESKVLSQTHLGNGHAGVELRNRTLKDEKTSLWDIGHDTHD